jgi:hypothetical protein
MFAHPTMTEGLKALFMSVPERLETHAWQIQHTPIEPETDKATLSAACVLTGQST